MKTNSKPYTAKWWKDQLHKVSPNSKTRFWSWIFDRFYKAQKRDGNIKN